MMATSEQFFEALRRPQVGLALCWEVIPQSGTPLRFTNHDSPITINGSTFNPTSSFSGSAMTSREGMSVDNLSLIGITSDEITEEDLVAGVWDDAEIYLYVAIWDQPGAGLHVMKRGWLGEIKSNGTVFETEVRGLAERLQRSRGKTYTLECNAQFGDSRCKLDLNAAGYVHDVTVIGLQDGRTFKTDQLQASGYFQYGTAQFLTGSNAGRRIEVLGHDAYDGGNWITTIEKLPFTIALGDTVRLTRGCDKLWTTCKGFGNGINFRGFKDIPTEATAMETPRAK